MKIFPAIDLFRGKCVRLLKGDYSRMTVYGDDPVRTAEEMESRGAEYLHIVDLDGARNGTTPDFDTVIKIAGSTSLFTEVGGGIRSMDTVERYLENGVDRVILGTAAVSDAEFLLKALMKYGDRIAVGADIRDGYVSVRGWTENSSYTYLDFCRKMDSLSVKTIICTDISKDGAMQGINTELYRKLSTEIKADITASGGVSDINDIKKLKDLGLYGAILGKAYYTGAVDLKDALEAAE